MPKSTKPGLGHDRMKFNRRTILKTIPLAGLAGLSSGAASARATFPETIPLPTGFQPEGIVTGQGTEFFVGSLATGTIFKGDLRTGEGDVLNPDIDDRVAVGLSYDHRSDHLFVAGQQEGEAYVYDAENGETVETYTLTEEDTFVNDVVVTSDAAFFTDSFRPVFYRVPLGPAGRLPDQSDVEEISLSGDFEQVEGFNSNGIDAPPNEAYLIIINSSTGTLYKVDPESGDASEIDLEDEALTAGDGILLDGNTLYVVRNQLNVIAVVELESDASEGEVVREITDPDFDVPTTIAEFGNALYAVNARFGISDPDNADYDVIRVPKQPDS